MGVPWKRLSVLATGVMDLRRRAEVTLGVPATLHEYQWEGVAFLYRSRCALLADEMGLGKTVQAAVALALLLNARNNIRRALIVAPAALTVNWMSELAAWAPSLAARRLQGGVRDRIASYLLPIPVVVGSYEQIRLDGLDRIPAKTFDIVILDEAQRIKTRDSTTAVACRLLPRQRSWALSATPLENRASDVRSILEFLDPSNLPDAPTDRLVTTLETLMLRRRKREVRGELAPVLVQDLELELTRGQRARYDELWANRRRDAAATPRKAAVVLLGLITRLKIICNFDSEAGTSAKLDALREVCEAAGPFARILVFSQFVDTLTWVAVRMAVPSDLLTGPMSQSDREQAISNFRSKPTPRALLVSLRAGGVGLNLGEATHVVVFDRWWNPAVENQAIHRAHRFIRDEPLHVIRFLTVDTIEERIAAILDGKQDLFEEVVESPDTQAKGFSVHELMRILDLSESTMLRDPSPQEGI